MEKVKNKKWSWELLCVAALIVGLVLVSYTPSAPTPTNGSKVEAKTIKVGIIGPMTQLQGEHYWIGAQYAADEINAAGGIKVAGVKHNIILVKANSNELASIADATSALERLLTVEKVDAVIGGYRSEAVLAMQEVIAGNPRVFLNPGSADPKRFQLIKQNYDKYKYIFGINIASDQQMYHSSFGALIAAAEFRKLGFQRPKVAIMADAALWAEPLIKLGQNVYPKENMEVVGVWRPQFSAADVTPELTAIRNAGAHIIAFISGGPMGHAFANQWGELKIPAAATGVNAQAMSADFWKSTIGQCDYLQTSEVYSNKVKFSDAVEPFHKGITAKFGKEPNMFSAQVYNAMYILKQGAERAGSLNTNALVAAIEKTDYKSITGRYVFQGLNDPSPHQFIFGPNHYTMMLIQWRNGEKMVIWPDGNELPQSLINAGAPSGWKGVKFPGTVNYKLPPWVVEYWKSKK